MQKMIKPTEMRKDPLIHLRSNKTPVNKDSIEAMTPETDKMVTGTFVNIECPGQTAKVCGKFYKGQQYFTRVFHDGEKASIPLSIARFINERICYDQASYILDESGNPIKSGKGIPRYKFMVDYIAA